MSIFAHKWIVLSVVSASVTSCFSSSVQDDYCRRFVGPDSYCDHSICHGSLNSCTESAIINSVLGRRQADADVVDSDVSISSGATGVQTMLVTNWDDYCRDKVGAASYCKTWDRFPVCQGSDVSCGDGEIATSTIPETTRAAGDKTTVPVTTTRSAAVLTTSGGTVNWDEYCQKEVGPTSYCKIWDASPVCQGSSVRCGNGAVVTTEHNFHPTTPHSGGDHEYCPGLPAGEYCGNINGEMALFLIEGDVFFFDYRYIHGVKVDLKEVPFHLYNCEEFVPDYSSWQMERLARELGLTTDQLRQKLTITYRRSSDSFHLYWERSVSTSMYHDEC